MSDLTTWQTLERRVVLSDRGPIQEIAVETVRLPDGHVIDDYFTIRLTDYALIFVEMLDGSIPVLRQYKHGVGRVCLGFPGGALEKGELPLDAARRELREELGCVSDEWSTVGSFVTNANQGCNTAHLFHAVGCRRLGEATAPDWESPDILYFRENDLLSPDVVEQFAGASHVALLALVTHPRLKR